MSALPFVLAYGVYVVVDDIRQHPHHMHEHDTTPKYAYLDIYDKRFPWKNGRRCSLFGPCPPADAPAGHGHH